MRAAHWVDRHTRLVCLAFSSAGFGRCSGTALTQRSPLTIPAGSQCWGLGISLVGWHIFDIDINTVSACAAKFMSVFGFELFRPTERHRHWNSGWFQLWRAHTQHASTYPLRIKQGCELTIRPKSPNLTLSWNLFLEEYQMQHLSSPDPTNIN